MCDRKELFHIRKIICDLTLDFEILNELSKNENDETILKKIILKPRSSDDFKKLILGVDTKYNTETLDKIAKYSHLYKINEHNLISLLSISFNTTIETKKYIFENYAKPNKDKLILDGLYDCIKNSKYIKYIELANEIKEFRNTI